MNDLNTIALNEQIFRKHIFIFSRELKKELEDSSSLLEKYLKRRENLYLLWVFCVELMWGYLEHATYDLMLLIAFQGK